MSPALERLLTAAREAGTCCSSERRELLAAVLEVEAEERVAAEGIPAVSGQLAELRSLPAPAMTLPAQMEELRGVLVELEAVAETIAHDGCADLEAASETAILLTAKALRLCPVAHDDQQGGKPVAP